MNVCPPSSACREPWRPSIAKPPRETVKCCPVSPQSFAGLMCAFWTTCAMLSAASREPSVTFGVVVWWITR